MGGQAAKPDGHLQGALREDQVVSRKVEVYLSLVSTDSNKTCTKHNCVYSVAVTRVKSKGGMGCGNVNR